MAIFLVCLGSILTGILIGRADSIIHKGLSTYSEECPASMGDAYEWGAYSEPVALNQDKPVTTTD